jgi:hypothetical protein
MAQVKAYHPDEAAAIAWLNQQPDRGGLLEAVGSIKNGRDERLYPARMSSLTGRPTPLGWLSHIALWYNYQTNPITQQRFEDVGNLMFPTSHSITDVYVLMQQYDIHYVVYGSLERQLWGSAAQQIIADHLPLVWQSNKVAIYGRPAHMPQQLVWLPASEWGEREYPTDGRKTPFRWMLGQEGRICLLSNERAVVQLSVELLETTGVGKMAMWHGSHKMLDMMIEPHHPRRWRVWLAIPAGTTTLTIRTDLPLRQDNGNSRHITLALAEPHLEVVAHGEGAEQARKMLHK